MTVVNYRKESAITMTKNMKRIAFVTAAALALAGCSSDASIASRNLSQEADDFKINRRVVFINGITDAYLLEIQGFCSIQDNSEMRPQLAVTCKVGEDSYKKHFLGLSDNVTYVVEQLESADVSAYRYRVFFRPEQIVPDIELKVEG